MTIVNYYCIRPTLYLRQHTYVLHFEVSKEILSHCPVYLIQPSSTYSPAITSLVLQLPAPKGSLISPVSKTTLSKDVTSCFPTIVLLSSTTMPQLDLSLSHLKFPSPNRKERWPDSYTETVGPGTSIESWGISTQAQSLYTTPRASFPHSNCAAIASLPEPIPALCSAGFWCTEGKDMVSIVLLYRVSADLQ